MAKGQPKRPKPTARISPRSKAKDREDRGVQPQSRFASIPQELFDEIVSYLPPPLPISYNCDHRFPQPPDLRYAEREAALRALSQTCTDLRRMARPRLWERLDMCWVPEGRKGHWYRYVMQELKRKASGVCRAPYDLQSRVRTVTVMVTRSDTDLALRAFRKLLLALPALRTIQILNCVVTKELARALGKAQLPTVHTLVIPGGAAPLVRACPNVKHIRCTGDKAQMIIDALVHCRCEIFEGASCRGPVMESLVKNAPDLRALEYEHYGEWASDAYRALQAVRGLKHLQGLTITHIPVSGEGMDDHAVALGREALLASSFPGRRKLVIRRPDRDHFGRYDNKCEVAWKSSVETYDP